jgi:hypothetical protein
LEGVTPAPSLPPSFIFPLLLYHLILSLISFTYFFKLLQTITSEFLVVVSFHIGPTKQVSSFYRLEVEAHRSYPRSQQVNDQGRMKKEGVNRDQKRKEKMLFPGISSF